MLTGYPGVCMLWDWGWTWSGLIFTGAPTGFLLIPPASENSNSTPGSIYVLDSLFDGVSTAVDARAMNALILDSSNIILDNIGVLNVDTMIAFANGYEVSIPAADTNFAIVGNVGKDGTTGMYTGAFQSPPDELLDLTSLGWFRNNYFGKSRPQYQGLGAGSFISVKDHGAVGDGSTDDTKAIIAALALATTSNVIYFPAGSYLVTSTITVSPNTRITGQVWSQLVAGGTFFADATAPQVMLKVGNEGDVGTVEISDMLFTSVGALPGLVMVEWNVAAETQGSVGMWDVHYRVGGAYGTQLQVGQCPPTPSINSGCIGAAMMMHITSNSNGYFENVWAWVADHDIDDPTNAQVTVAVGRGILIESAGPTWLYGTASEHSMLYQYNFAYSTNTFAGMIQTESPYFQHAAKTESPGPFNTTDNIFTNDPTFPDDFDTCTGDDLACNLSWSIILQGNNNLTIAGAGLYSWFDAYDQTLCVDAQDCQQRLVNDQGENSGLFIWNLITIGSVEMISDTSGDNTKTIFAAPNTQLQSHPYWSALASYLSDYEAEDDDDCTNDDARAECQIDTICDWTKQFDSLEAIQAADTAGTIADECVSFYALEVLSSMINTEITNYTAVDTGYDGLFKYYVEYVKNLVPDALSSLMATATATSPNGGAGQAYFDCTYTRKFPASLATSFTQACPVPWSYFAVPGTFSITYTLRDSDGFYNTLSSKYGIDKTWIDFADTHTVTKCGRGSGLPCAQTDVTNNGIPQAASDITPSNPKDIITQALPQISNLQNTIYARQMDLLSHVWGNNTQDIVDTVSMPVFMVSQAIQSMNSVKDIAKTEKKEDQIKLVVMILGIIFSFIPFLDSAGPAIGLADGTFEMVAAAGNIGLAIQGIVAYPSSAPMELLSALTLGKTKTTEDFAGLAAARRAISDDDLTKIGPDVKAAEDTLTTLLTHGCFKP